MKTLVVVITAFAALALAALGFSPITSRTSKTKELSQTVGRPMFMSPHANPIVVSGGRVFVVNTPADTVDIIDVRSRAIVKRVNVGVNPVGIAVRPDGKEVWVANHVSDSVSVIDSDSKSPTFLQVISTVQDIDPDTRATRFDEPVGIAFASNDKAYVALSSENQIAVINTRNREVEKRLEIPSQDPRAIVVRGDRLYVIPFESGNKTQLSGGKPPFDGNLVTFDAWKHSIFNNNVLSLGHVVDIVKNPKVPDRDLFVFDTKTDTLVKAVDTLGTLLYGLAVDSKGGVFIAQTDPRNDVNGRSGTKKHGLKELENRPFLNRITHLKFDGDAPTTPKFIDLEPLPPVQPKPGTALATPFAIQVSDDDTTLLVSASGSDKLFTVDVATGATLGRVDVGAVPEGIALEPSTGGKLSRAWVLNAAADSVSLVNVSDPAKPSVLATIPLEDPTNPAIKRGRIAFSTAAASTTGTYSCLSCHPESHTDQLLWVLNTPIVTGGNQIMPRSTMPVRGLRDTEPYHWDGVPGDPFGGMNSAHIYSSVPPNSRIDDPLSAPLNLIDGGLENTMRTVGDPSKNDEGKLGNLSKAEREDMARFILSVSYPPAQRRAYNNVVSSEGVKGFKLFHIDGDNDPDKSKPNVCGDCHRMPFLTSAKTPGTGMDAPTWRGAYDRWLILPQGRLNIIDFDFYRDIAEKGVPERSLWRFAWGGRERFDPVWNMVLEGSTGYSGAFARQLTLNKVSASAKFTADLLNALELSASEGGIVLQGEGIFLKGRNSAHVSFQFDGRTGGGVYVESEGVHKAFNRAELITLASKGRFVGTFTGRLGRKADYDHPQPALWTVGPIQTQRGHEAFPLLYPGIGSMKMSGRHIERGAYLYIDGRRVDGSLSIAGGTITVAPAKLPAVGIHLLQVQNPDGLFSNDVTTHPMKRVGFG
ncbi:MAG: hypothetical protein NT023_16895 [Armatimonadetes bacterium]|nr:hypothetical protein [Armatimonadota bacterium]